MSPSTLNRIVQSDFGVGMQPDIARHLIDPRGVYDIANGLLDDDGSVYRRGGAEYLTTAAFGDGLTFLWDGVLEAGHRTVVANDTDFGVLAADDLSTVNLGGVGADSPVSAREVEGLLFIAGSPSYIYGGSRKTAAYSTGTVAVTNGSKVVTGTGFTANVDKGMLLQRGNERVYAVHSIDSNTQITLREEYEGVTNAAVAYSLRPLYTITALDPYEESICYAVAGNRLCFITADLKSVGFSSLDLVNGRIAPHINAATDKHTFAEGVEVIGMNAIADSLFVFTTGGVWVVQGMSYDIVDDLGNPQHRLDNVNRDLILWGNEGVTGWRNGLVVPALDAIYAIDPVSGPLPLSLPIDNLYRAYVTAGFSPGTAAVFRSHLFLPILDGAGGWVDLLVARLDRPTQVREQTGFPWTRQFGEGAMVTACCVRAPSNGPPLLLAAGSEATSRVMTLNSFFEPGASNKTDPDNSIHVMTIITRDYEGGSLNTNRFRRLRLTAELIDAASDDPEILLDYSLGGTTDPGTQWGNFLWGIGQWTSGTEAEWIAVQGRAPEEDGRMPYTWHINKAAHRLRFRIRSSGACARLTLRHIEIFVAPSQTLRH